MACAKNANKRALITVLKGIINTIMRAEFVNPFLVSLLNVLKTMATMDLTPQKPRVKKDEVARGDVSGLIGMVGPKVAGSMSISFEEGLALEIMEKMLGERPKTINEEISDMVGEITNMVAGGAKRILSESGYDFDMATPIVVSGRGHTISHKCKGAIIIMPFETQWGNAHIEISFE